ncbi:MAG: hypothetical protein AB7G06_01265 [Bdellovibrionales bacterium]
MPKGYLICPVTNASAEMQAKIDAFVAKKAEEGWDIHNPKYDAPQDDETGVGIYIAHFTALQDCQRVFIIWDSNSRGSICDFGAVMFSGLPVEVVDVVNPDIPGKSFLKIMQDIEANGPIMKDGRVIRALPPKRGSSDKPGPQ